MRDTNIIELSILLLLTHAREIPHVVVTYICPSYTRYYFFMKQFYHKAFRIMWSIDLYRKNVCISNVIKYDANSIIKIRVIIIYYLTFIVAT